MAETRLRSPARVGPGSGRDETFCDQPPPVAEKDRACRHAQKEPLLSQSGGVNAAAEVLPAHLYRTAHLVKSGAHPLPNGANQ